MYTIMTRCWGGWSCECPTGPFFPPVEVEAARVRVLKRRIRRRIAAMQLLRLRRQKKG